MRSSSGDYFTYWAAAAALLGYPALGALRLARMETAWLAVALVVLSTAVAMVGSDAAAPPPLVDAGARELGQQLQSMGYSLP